MPSDMLHILVCGGLLFIVQGNAEPSGVYTSKACFGSPGLPCTRHDLQCSCGQIAIYDAYFRASRYCSVGGISSCSFDIRNIKDVGTRYEFDKADKSSLYDRCSSLSSCKFNAGRRASTAFSVVKYTCIESTNEFGYSCSQVFRTTTVTCEYTVKHQANTRGIWKDIYEQSTKPVLLYSTNTPGTTQYTTHQDISTPTTTYSTDGQATVSGLLSNTNTPGSTQHTTHRGISTPTTNMAAETNESIETLHVQSSTSTGPMQSTLKSPNVSSSMTGTIVGVLVTCIVITAGVVVIVVFFLKRRGRQEKDKGDKNMPVMSPVGKEAYSMAGAFTESKELENESPKHGSGDCDYDYATAEGVVTSKEYQRIDLNSKAKLSHKHDITAIEGDYDHIGNLTSTQCGLYHTANLVTKSIGHIAKLNSSPEASYENNYDRIGYKPSSHPGIYDTTASVASAIGNHGEAEDVYNYDHLNGNMDANKTTIVPSAEYDTPVSSRTKVAESENMGNVVEGDYYGYNHLGSSHTVKTIQNDYDTSASAARKVAEYNGVHREEQ